MVSGVSKYFLVVFQKYIEQIKDNIISSKHFPLFSEDFIMKLCNETIEKLSKDSPIVGFSPKLQGNQKIVIVGDITSCFSDLIRVIMTNGLPPQTKYVFLGKYVNNGAYGLEVVTFLFALISQYPEHVVVLRGLSEFREENMQHGFQKQIQNTYQSTIVWDCINKVFDYLPLVSIVNKTYLCVSGGISNNTTIDALKKVKLPITSFENKVVADIVWSEPCVQNKDLVEKSIGFGYLFGPGFAKSFLKKYNFKHLIVGCKNQVDLRVAFESSTYFLYSITKGDPQLTNYMIISSKRDVRTEQIAVNGGMARASSSLNLGKYGFGIKPVNKKRAVQEEALQLYRASSRENLNTITYNPCGMDTIKEEE